MEVQIWKGLVTLEVLDPDTVMLRLDDIPHHNHSDGLRQGLLEDRRVLSFPPFKIISVVFHTVVFEIIEQVERILGIIPSLTSLSVPACISLPSVSCIGINFVSKD